MKYHFHVVQKETFCDYITVDAETEEEAQKLVEIELSNEDLSGRKNTYDGIETSLTLLTEEEADEIGLN